MIERPSRERATRYPDHTTCEKLTAVTLEIPFEHRGRRGTIRAAMLRNEDPAR